MKFKIDNLLNLLKDKSGSICAAVACVGVGTTAYLSSKAGVQAYVTIDPDLDTKEKIKQYVKCYWKAGLSAALTVGAIIGSDRIHVGKEVALAGVAAMWKDKFVGLDKKMEEVVGEEKANEIREETVKEQIKRSKEKPTASQYREVREGTGKILVYEPYTDQYIVTSTERIAWALLAANEKLAKDFDVRLNFIIKMIGGVPKPLGDKIGWNWENESQDCCWSYYGGPWIEKCMDIYTDDTGMEALCLFYQVDPTTQNPEDMIYSE